MDEIMNPEQACQQPQPKKWLQILLYVHLVNIVIAVLNLVPGLSKVTTWLSEGMLLAVAFVLLFVVFLAVLMLMKGYEANPANGVISEVPYKYFNNFIHKYHLYHYIK